VSRRTPYGEVERSSFSVLCNQLAAALVAVIANSSGAGADSLRSELERRTIEYDQLVERLRTVDAARQLLLKNVVSAQDKAGRRFATELHDDALQKLTAAELHLKRVEQTGDRRALMEAQTMLLQTEESLRRMLFEVRPPTLEDPGGLERTIRERLAMVKAITDADVLFELDLPEDLAYELKSMIFRQVAEALSNVEKHAHATRVEVTIRVVDGGVYGLVSDNGRGFVVEERNNIPGHMGLLSLRERAILVGGWYRISSQPGSGTKIEFGVPLE